MAEAIADQKRMRKRQFQPSISSYLTTHDKSNSSQSPQRTTYHLAAIPAETQASLLDVGMRVRKSVHEGYKTHKTMAKSGAPYPRTASSAYYSLSQQDHHSQRGRELTPYCGLPESSVTTANVNFPPSSAPAMLQGQRCHIDDDANPPSLTTSQDTLGTSQSSYSSIPPPAPAESLKRSYEEEIEADLDAIFEEMDGRMDDQDTFAAVPARRIAKLKHTGMKHEVIAVEQDFQEAAFLRPPDVMEI